MPTDRQEPRSRTRFDCDECDYDVAPCPTRAESFRTLLNHREIAHRLYPTDPERLALDALEQAETELSRIRGWASRRTFCTCMKDFGDCPHAEVATLLDPSPSETKGEDA